MDKVLYAILRTAAAYLLLLIVTRLMGRKSISQMTFFDFAVAITLGSVTANIGLGSDSNFASSVSVLLTLGVLGVLVGFIHISSFKLRKWINSEPVVVIANGELVKQNMKRIRLTVNELTTLLREKNYFNIRDVHFAILENDGKLSVLPKAAKKPLTPSDMQQNPAETGLTSEIIIDGAVLKDNLVAAGRSERWLFAELEKKGIQSAKEVFFAALDSTGTLYISKGSKPDESPGEYGVE